jgi:hypothetical protein
VRSVAGVHPIGPATQSRVVQKDRLMCAPGHPAEIRMPRIENVVALSGHNRARNGEHGAARCPQPCVSGCPRNGIRGAW